MSIYGPPPRKPAPARSGGLKRFARVIAGIAILSVLAIVAVHALLDLDRASATERLQIERAESIRLDMERMREASNQQILDLMPAVPAPPILDMPPPLEMPVLERPLPIETAEILPMSAREPQKVERLQTADILR